jgi:hypothetical protein
MRNVFAVALIAAALGAGMTHAQNPAPSTVTVKEVQPGLLEATGPRVHEAVGAGIQKITATPGKSSSVQSPWGHIYFAWPKDVKQVAFTIETAKNGGVTISAPGFTMANKDEYRAAFDAVVPLAIAKAKSQKEGKTKG